MLTVTTPATNFRLTTVEAVRNHGVPATDIPDALAETLIDRASATAAKYCRRVFATETVRETLYDVGALNLLPRRTPIDLTSLVVTEDETELTGGTDYIVDHETLSLTRLSGDQPICWTADKIVIDYTAGYVLPDDDGTRTLPADVEAAVLYLIGDMAQTIKQQPTGGNAIRALTLDGVGSVTYATPQSAPGADAKALSGLNEVAKILLAPYVVVAL